MPSRRHMPLKKQPTARKASASHFKGKTRRNKTVLNKTVLNKTLLLNLCGLMILTLLVFLVLDSGLIPKRKVRFAQERVAAFQIPAVTVENFSQLSDKYAINLSELLTLYAFENDFFPQKTAAPTQDMLEQEFIRRFDDIKSHYAKSAITPYTRLFDSIIDSMTVFPVPLYTEEGLPTGVMYGDAWGSAAKSPLGLRLFEGTDIYDRENLTGRVPVLSVGNGTVTQVGYHDAAGFMVSVSAGNGVTYTYAHLDSFSPGLAQNDKVQAGQTIGFMGNSGNGQKEGQGVGLAVRLHFGISVDTDFFGKNFYINPYPFLRLLEYRLPKVIPLEEDSFLEQVQIHMQ